MMEFSFCSGAGTGRPGRGVSKIQGKSLQTAGLSGRAIMKSLKGCSLVKDQDKKIYKKRKTRELERWGIN